MRRTHALREARLTAGETALRAVWGIVWLLLYRPSPRLLHGWRRFLLRSFGARIERGAKPYPRVRIWAPWNLTMAEQSCLADDVDCYSVAPVVLGPHATVSQYSYLCTASHDYRDPAMPLVVAAITIEAEAWVAADVFVAPGVKVGRGAVVGARSGVFSDVEPWAVVAGSPAKRQGVRPAFVRQAGTRTLAAPQIPAYPAETDE
jgi:putative colanic acid biosynthesis acetyltransferase WcaF